MALPNVRCERAPSSNHAKIRYLCGKTSPVFLLHAQKIDKDTLLHIQGNPPRRVLENFRCAQKGQPPPPHFIELANFRQNSMTSHFAEPPPPFALVVDIVSWIGDLKLLRILRRIQSLGKLGPAAGEI